MSSHFLHSRYNASAKTGFGLIELMVSISIMVLVAGVVLARQSSFNGAVLLRSQAYEVALSLREAQLNAVSSIGNAGNYRNLIGVHFDTANDSQYKIFKDANSNGFYNATEVFGKQGFIDSKFEIRAIRAVGDSITGSGISIVFERPNFDARFFDAAGEVNASQVEIDISKRDDTGTGSASVRTVQVTATGQIAVQ